MHDAGVVFIICIHYTVSAWSSQWRCCKNLNFLAPLHKVCLLHKLLLRSLWQGLLNCFRLWLKYICILGKMIWWCHQLVLYRSDVRYISSVSVFILFIFYVCACDSALDREKNMSSICFSGLKMERNCFLSDFWKWLSSKLQSSQNFKVWLHQ